MVSQDRQPKPEGWGEYKIEELATVVSGGTPSSQIPGYWDGNIPWCTPTDITATQGPYLKSTQRNISQSGLDNSSAQVLPAGSLLLCTRATIGDLKIALFPVATNQGFKSLIPCLGFDTNFLYYKILTLKNELAQMGSGSTFLEVSKRDVLSFLISAPEEKEQKAIARVLSNADQLILATEELIKKKKKIKKSLMQELLTGKTRLPGFSGEWEEMALGDVASFQKGKGLGKKDLVRDGKMLCVHYGQLFTKYKEIIHPGEIISKTNLSGDVVLSKANDVLMPTSDVTPKGLATASVIKEDGVVIGGDVLVIRSDCEKVLGDFLSRNICMDKNQILDLATGTTVFHIYASDMKRFTLQFPPLEEQKAIARVLSGADQEIGLLEEKLLKCKKIKQGMMQELLTGKTRLPEFRG